MLGPSSVRNLLEYLSAKMCDKVFHEVAYQENASRDTDAKKCVKIAYNMRHRFPWRQSGDSRLQLESAHGRSCEGNSFTRIFQMWQAIKDSPPIKFACG